MYNAELVAEQADHIIEEINDHIDYVIQWQLDPTKFNLDEFDDLYPFQLQVKQQLLFSLIKKVTK